MSIQRCVWLPIVTVGEMERYKQSGSRPSAAADRLTAPSPLSLDGHTCPDRYQRQLVLSAASSQLQIIISF